MTSPAQSPLGKFIQVSGDLAQAVDRVTAALKEEGFGVLTEIDVQQTLKKKLDVDTTPYKILGACNPQLAHRALQIAPEVGLLLPCNVTVRQVNDGMTEIALVDPLAMLGVVAHPDLTAVAEEAKARLERVAHALEQAQVQ